MTCGWFVAGTSTEVGKTYVAALVAAALHGAGQRVGVYKPVASGCRQERGELVADDAVALWNAAGRPRSLAEVCPQRFLAPLAPPLAAVAEQRHVDPDLLFDGLEPWRGDSDVLVVEGAGGLMSPLTAELYNIDLAARLKLPLLVVAANQLGVINAVLQTIITARAKAPDLPIAGVVLNQQALRPDDESLESNAGEIAVRAGVPLLATIGQGQTALDPGEVAGWLRR